jgi:hypothetical protein
MRNADLLDVAAKEPLLLTPAEAAAIPRADRTALWPANIPAGAQAVR